MSLLIHPQRALNYRWNASIWHKLENNDCNVRAHLTGCISIQIRDEREAISHSALSMHNIWHSGMVDIKRMLGKFKPVNFTFCGQEDWKDMFLKVHPNIYTEFVQLNSNHILILLFQTSRIKFYIALNLYKQHLAFGWLALTHPRKRNNIKTFNHSARNNLANYGYTWR